MQYWWIGGAFVAGMVVALVANAIYRSSRKPRTYLMTVGLPQYEGAKQYKVSAETEYFYGFWYSTSAMGRTVTRWIWMPKTDSRIKEVVKG